MKNASLRSIVAAALWLAAVATACAAVNLSDAIPLGPQVEVGKLDNGLTYYIRKNNRPEKRVELRLVVKAGSVLEDEDQRGLAHFVEHMAFNGSTHFKKHELISYLQSIGLKFGADLNAYTNFNETVYILPVPTDKPEHLATAFQVLEDWAHGITFSEADVNAERGIILEEARLRKGANERLTKASIPKIYAGSRYAHRLPIGDENIVKTSTVETIRKFYTDWYRPKLMAVVVVGDVDPAQARSMVQSHFGKLTNPTVERPREIEKIPPRQENSALIFADPELTNDSVRIFYPGRVHQPEVTLGDYRKHLIDHLISAMIAARMEELTLKATSPLVAGSSGPSKLMPGYRTFVSMAVIGWDGYGAAVAALLEENERARRFGFGANELDRAKANTLRKIEQAHAEEGKTDSAHYASEYIHAFLFGEPLPGIDHELAYHKELLPAIGLEEVNQAAADLIPKSSSPKLVILASNARSGEAPTEASLLNRVGDGERSLVFAKQDKALPNRLMTQLPTPGTIMAEHKNDTFGLVELDLSNGVKVILKPTDFKNDQILFNAVRQGGQSLYPQNDMYNARYATEFASVMGLPGLAPQEIKKVMAGKLASVSADLYLYADTLNGSSGNADLESLLQLVHLKFAPPRKADQYSYQSFVARKRDALKNIMAQPEITFLDTIAQTEFGSHPRLLLTPRAADMAGLDPERLTQIYSDRFGSAKGMTFFLVGSFDPQAIKPLIATYLGSLPSTDLPTKYVDLNIRPIKTAATKVLAIGVEPKAIVSMSFAGDADYSEKQQVHLNALQEIVNIRLTDILREKLSLIYTASVSGSLTAIPNAHFRFSMVLPCAPENTDKVVTAALAEIKTIQDKGPQLSDLEKFKANWKTKRRQVLRENEYWLNRLSTAALLQREMVSLEAVERWIDELNVQDVQALARQYLQTDTLVQVVMKPAEAAQAAKGH